jgi:hypothetical protein
MSISKGIKVIGFAIGIFFFCFFPFLLFVEAGYWLAFLLGLLFYIFCFLINQRAIFHGKYNVTIRQS